MRLRIEHRTQHWYAEPVQHAVQRLCLTPSSSAHQTVHDWALKASGRLYAGVDGYGNVAHHCTLEAGSLTSDVQAQGVVETHASPWLDDDPSVSPSPWFYLRATALTDADHALATFASEQGSDSAAAREDELIALAQAVAGRVRYESGHTGVETSARHAFDVGRGVCQDQAHVFIAACRSRGWPARYVSGYFHAPGAEDLASHAWADVCIDIHAARWFSIDVTHACAIDERHVRLAVGPDYAACSPVRGVRQGGGTERMEVTLKVMEVEG